MLYKYKNLTDQKNTNLLNYTSTILKNTPKENKQTKH